jgi:nicotinic acid mononucleotide adenylyltransferase
MNLVCKTSRPEEEKKSLHVGTAELLEMLIKNEPESDFTFCLGADTFLDLTEWKWRRSRDVLRLLGGRLLVVNRKGITANLEERVAKVNETESANAVLLNVPSLNEVSSSAVRSCTHVEKLQEMLSGGVFEYMQTNRLYAFSDESIYLEPVVVLKKD